jgi:uncharacterized protein YndB with AHSA1/START domain
MPAVDVARSVEIAAPPATVYSLITDLTTLAELAEETTAMRWTKGSGPAPGSVFRGANRNGWHRWTTTCTVTDAESGSRFAFEVRHPPGLPIARWQYDIEATTGGCVVTETTWDRRPTWFAKAAVLATGVRDRAATNGTHIEATLQRLKARAEA